MAEELIASPLTDTYMKIYTFTSYGEKSYGKYCMAGNTVWQEIV